MSGQNEGTDFKKQLFDTNYKRGYLEASSEETNPVYETNDRVIKRSLPQRIFLVFEVRMHVCMCVCVYTIISVCTFAPVFLCLRITIVSRPQMNRS